MFVMRLRGCTLLCPALTVKPVLWLSLTAKLAHRHLLPLALSALTESSSVGVLLVCLVSILAPNVLEPQITVTLVKANSSPIGQATVSATILLQCGTPTSLSTANSAPLSFLTVQHASRMPPIHRILSAVYVITLTTLTPSLELVSSVISSALPVLHLELALPAPII